MIYEVKTKDGEVQIDTEVYYSGKDKPEDIHKTVRKILGFPVTKQLVYYIDVKDKSSIRDVTEYRIVKLYEVTERWATVEVVLDNGEKNLINSMFLNEMQKPSFIEEMKLSV